MVFWWVLVHFGPRMWAMKTPVLGSQSGPQRKSPPTQSGSLTKTHHRGTPSKSNRKSDVTHASTVRFQLAIWISRHQRRPTFVCRRDFTKTVGSQTHLGDQRRPTSVLRPFISLRPLDRRSVFFFFFWMARSRSK
jgi:hypothetical protein